MQIIAQKRGTGLRDEYSETCDNMNSDRVFTLVSSWLWKAARVVARILKKGHLSWKMYVLVKIAKKGSRQTNIKLTYKTITPEKITYVEFDAKQLVSNIFVTLRQQYKNNDINTDSKDKINNNNKIVAAVDWTS